VPLAVLTGTPLLLAGCSSRSSAFPRSGTFFPAKVSFLLSMRYYAGNWAYNIWLFRKGAVKKLDRLKKASDTVYVQLAKFVPDPLQLEVAKAMMLVTRFMHCEGRPLLEALPAAVDDIEDYEWHEGELHRRHGARLELRRRSPERRAAAARDPAAVRLRGGRRARGLGRVAAAVRRDHALAGH
jgi:hypothetical protein